MSKQAGTVGVQLLDLIKQATADDLQTIDDDIAAKVKELDGLKSVRQLLATALGVEVKPTRTYTAKQPPAVPPTPALAPVASQKPPAIGDTGSVTNDRRLKAARYILKNGPTPSTALARLFDIPLGSATATFEHSWFYKTDAGLDITNAGRAAANGPL